MTAPLTAAERQRMEARLAELERALPNLDAACQGALLAYDRATERGETDRAWARYTEHADAFVDATAEAADIRARLGDDEQRAIAATHGPELRR